MGEKQGLIGSMLVACVLIGALPDTLRQDWAPFLLGLAGGSAVLSIGFKGAALTAI